MKKLNPKLIYRGYDIEKEHPQGDGDAWVVKRMDAWIIKRDGKLLHRAQSEAEAMHWVDAEKRKGATK